MRNVQNDIQKETSLCPPPPAPSKGGELRGIFVCHFCLFENLFSLGTYNDEVINPHTIRLSGLLRFAHNDGDLFRHHSFLQGIYHMPGATNDNRPSIDKKEKNPLILAKIAIYLQKLY